MNLTTKKEAKLFLEMLNYATHAIAGIMVNMNECQPYYAIPRDTGITPSIDSEEAMNLFNDLKERIKKDETVYKGKCSSYPIDRNRNEGNRKGKCKN